MHKSLIRRLFLSLSMGVVLAVSGMTNISAGSLTPVDAQMPNAGTPKEASPKSGTRGQPATSVYIVRLTEPAIASYRGGIPGLKGTSRYVTGERRLNTKSSAAKAYGKYLNDRQNNVLSRGEHKIGRQARVTYRYQHAFNGFAVELTGKEARAFASIEGVASVTRETLETPETDNGPAWIGAPYMWSAGHEGSKGEGAVIAVLDTGINHDHPSFADIGGDGYDHTNPLGSGNYIPGSYCDAVDPSFCNDKLIGAWDMVQTSDDPGAPEDSDGHGSHTASTAAGNVTDAHIAAPTTDLDRSISGVAPHANLIVYDVCVETCPSAALLAAINQVLIDNGELPNGIASLNYSISGGSNPYNEPMELGFLAAADAGIYVATSAGNSGPGPATVGHRSPWLAATAAMTHDRVFSSTLMDLTSDGDSLPDIQGQSITSGYGPAPIINSADLEDQFPGSTLCGLGSIGDNIPPWPPGTFNGEIVACTRGTFGRVEKGENALAAGAGGYVLMDNGGGVVADPHALPAIHISQADGEALAAWMAANTNPMATIGDYTVESDPNAGDIMAGFSSRGPNMTFDVLKPDIGAPGVSILAAVLSDGSVPPPEFGFLSGTSMASPHNAGAGALMTLLHPDWSPHQIRSALMMTANNANTRKEDGETPTDPHDLGAGRIDLTQAGHAGLLLDESTANFLAADPDLGGDPSTLNIASMMDSACVGKCAWARTFEGARDDNKVWNLSASTPAGVGLKINPTSQIIVKKGHTKEVRVEADTTYADTGWNYAEVQLTPKNGNSPELHLPIAVFVTPATDGNLFTKTVDASTASDGDILNYELSIRNGPLEGEISLVDKEPRGAKFVPGSATAEVTGGTIIQDVQMNGQFLTFSAELDKGGIDVILDPWDPDNGLFGGSPFGYIPLPAFGVPPLPCSSVCDDTSILLEGLPPFLFDGVEYTSLVMGSNGIIIPGDDDTEAFSNANQFFPDPAAPNAIAPFWTDLDLDGTSDSDTGAGTWYAAVFNSGAFTVLEWHGVEEWGVPGVTYTIQIQIGNVGSGYEGIWFTYGELPAGLPASLSVGAENVSGTAGGNYYYNGDGTPPMVGGENDLKVQELIGGTATVNFQMEANCSVEAIVNEASISTADQAERAVAVTRCN